MSLSTNVAVFIWSPGRVLLLDPLSGGVRAGASFNDFAGDTASKSAIVLIAHRGSIVRQVPVPSLSKEQIVPLLTAKLLPLLPAGLENYVSGFRLTKDLNSAGKLAVVGAVKSESVRSLYAEAHSAKINILAVLPSPFGSWIAAYMRGLRNGIVVSREANDLCLDVIAEGELKYSRFCVLPESPTQLLIEIERTVSSAGTAVGSILLLGDLELPGAEREPGGLGRFVDSPQNIEKQLFSLELPEHRNLRDKKKLWASGQRAIAAAALAVAAWSYVLYSRQIQEDKIQQREAVQAAIARGENVRRKAAVDEAVRLRRSQHLINIAFDPAQTFGDVVAVLTQDSDDKSWITGLSLERGKPMTIRGQAKDGMTVSKLVSKLSTESRFRDVKLIFANKGQIHDSPTVQFAISGVPIGNLPFDREVGLDKKKK